MTNSDEPNSPAAGEPLSGSMVEKNGGLQRSTGTAPVAGASIRIWSLALAAAVAAGVIGGAIAETRLIPASGDRLRKYDYSGKSAPAAPTASSTRAGSVSPSPAQDAGLRNAVLSYGMLGAALGLSLGLAGGLIHRSLLRTVLAGATGLVLGGVTGVVMTRVLAPIYYQHSSADDLTYSLIVHGGIWAAAGAVAGLAFGLGLGGRDRMVRATVGGAGAALLATGIYEIAGGIMFPSAMTNLPVSLTWQTRLGAQLLVALLVAAGAVLAAGSGAGIQGFSDPKDRKDEVTHRGGATASG